MPIDSEGDRQPRLVSYSYRIALHVSIGVVIVAMARIPAKPGRGILERRETRKTRFNFPPRFADRCKGGPKGMS